MRTRTIREPQLSNEVGASAVEYGLLVAAISAIIVGIVFGLGGIVGATFQQTEDCIVAIENGPNCGPAAGP
ncbi:MAG TPA: Flp family type IVb pilin [Kineosporiaceae bacterium]|nr:Flp family type IVb pilin [Kineosporiaceae bacterium]